MTRYHHTHSPKVDAYGHFHCPFCGRFLPTVGIMTGTSAQPCMRIECVRRRRTGYATRRILNRT